MAFFDTIISEKPLDYIEPVYTSPVSIGSNDYDADMDVVASFVRARLQPDNIIAHASVVNYYISRMYNYWLKVVDTNPKYGDYVASFTELMENYQRNFTETKKLDVYQSNRILYFLVTILCNESPGDLEHPSSDIWTYLYPLPNFIGIFGLNTYLYAYFHEVILIGFPDREAKYDNTWGCPSTFTNHDYQHTDRINIFLFHPSKIYLRNFYNFYIRDFRYTQLQKMCLIYCTWFFIHEYNRIIRLILMDNRIIIREVGEAFARETNKFSDFTNTPKQANELVNYLVEISQKGYIEMDKNQRDLINAIAIDPVKFVNVFHKPKGKYYGFADTVSDFIMAFWYFLQQFRLYVKDDEIFDKYINRWEIIE